MNASFYDWCIENDHNVLLDMWENGDNDISPKDVTFRSDRKVKFSCGDPNHPVKLIRVASVTDPNRTGLTMERFCVGCHSVGKYLIDNYGEDYLWRIWSDKNELSPFEIAANSKSKKIWLKCLNNPTHPDYDLTAGNICVAFGCPYCRNRRLYDGNNFALLYPQVYDYWSDKNTTTPDQYVVGSHDEAWFKCPIEFHKDYKREIRFEIEDDFKCPICLRIEAARKGADHPYYTGNQTENSRERSNSNYRHWRETVFERDDYTCQCCGRRGVYLNAHHIYSYAFHPEVRYLVSNGLTLCQDCHDMKIDGSLHYTYGNRDVSPDELEEYINNKRKKLGIDNVFSVKEYVDQINPVSIPI